ncbi:hypothetical protein EDB85DRAFT_2143726 [Lactarius pseudohatsudake]|nr:hypothetical protein EDB85DRAFT_2143726 [Lactarius pseudohatsudake]
MFMESGKMSLPTALEDVVRRLSINHEDRGRLLLICLPLSSLALALAIEHVRIGFDYSLSVETNEIYHTAQVAFSLSSPILARFPWNAAIVESAGKFG